jgi:hypothetical protein
MGRQDPVSVDAGYLEGEPLDPLAGSASMELLNVMSVLHAIYVRCILPYVGRDTVALEIGPGKGAWTKTMLQAREIWCLDALPAEEHGFYDYLGHPSHVRYLQASGPEGLDLPDRHFDFMFSFGCLCHLPPSGLQAYAQGLFPKLKPGGHCFWMVADYEKLNGAFEGLEFRRLLRLLLPEKARYAPLRWLMLAAMRAEFKRKRLTLPEDEGPSPGRWYHMGTRAACEMLRRCGYQVLQSDVGASPRDPIIHFCRP